MNDISEKENAEHVAILSRLSLIKSSAEVADFFKIEDSQSFISETSKIRVYLEINYMMSVVEEILLGNVNYLTSLSFIYDSATKMFDFNIGFINERGDSYYTTVLKNIEIVANKVTIKDVGNIKGGGLEQSGIYLDNIDVKMVAKLNLFVNYMNSNKRRVEMALGLHEVVQNGYSQIVELAFNNRGDIFSKARFPVCEKNKDYQLLYTKVKSLYTPCMESILMKQDIVQNQRLRLPLVGKIKL